MLLFLVQVTDEKFRTKLEELYITYHRDMYITAYSILKDYYLAEDIVQDAIIRVYKNLDKISDLKSKKTRAYLLIIVRNLSFSEYNKRKGIILLEENDVNNIIDDEILIEEELLNKEKTKVIFNYLKKIHSSYSDILTLRFYYELSISEISDALGITENNVSVRINRAIKSLKKIILEGGN